MIGFIRKFVLLKNLFVLLKKNVNATEIIEENFLMKPTCKKRNFLFVLLAAAIIPASAFAAEKKDIADNKISQPMVADKLFDIAQSNENWKLAYATGKNAQVVFMNISPKTNPKNEIGMETHAFDQVIFIVKGDGKAILDKKVSMTKPGDMIFIPQGTPHNVINLSPKEELKIVSIYSDTDIPAHSSYKTKEDEPQD
ncbi:MAG TPA: cupin domain-containing protein [Alphaproteobacteria bacterium]|nr:cupin domain-containing protein [Alphaproteobacteria bacterium]